MKVKVADKFYQHKQNILDILTHFDAKGTDFGNQKRNTIKLFDLQETAVNVKSFKVPNFINKIAYKFFRKSKAQRSFEYANYLQNHSIGTPQPIAFAEDPKNSLFWKSYYISEHLSHDLTYRELVKNVNYPNHEKLLRAFTRFTFQLHENDILFLDHSPGNTLIQLKEGDYKFFLVDLNRMKFTKLGFNARMKNFSRLTPKKEMVEVMASEYAKFIHKPSEEVFEKMWFYTQKFQAQHHRKKTIKNNLRK